MIRESITLDGTIELLNEVLTIDGGALRRLIETRTWCSKELEAHPTVQIGGHEDREVAGCVIKVPVVGLLGILNGLFGVDDEERGAISAVFEEGKLVRFQRTSVREDEVLDELGELSTLSAEDIEAQEDAKVISTISEDHESFAARATEDLKAKSGVAGEIEAQKWSEGMAQTMGCSVPKVVCPECKQEVSWPSVESVVGSCIFCGGDHGFRECPEYPEQWDKKEEANKEEEK